MSVSGVSLNLSGVGEERSDGDNDVSVLFCEHLAMTYKYTVDSFGSFFFILGNDPSKCERSPNDYRAINFESVSE